MLEVNRIYCQNCIDGLKQLDDNSIDMTFTSPPFKDEDVEGDYWAFYDKWFTEVRRVTKNVVLIVQSATRVSDIFAKYPPNRLMIWYKGVMVCAYRYNPIFCYQMRPDYKINKYIWSDVIGCYSIKTCDKVHKDQDPVYVYQTAIGMFKDCQLILDPFAGSGTTAEACKILNRNFIGFELNSDYCKMAERRLENIQARLI